VLLAVVFCVAVDGALLAKYLADDAVLRQVVELDPDLPPSRKVLTLLDYIDKHVARVETTDESFFPGLSFLRPTALQVLEKGGDCADRSRLLIELLKREGVHASKVALHDRQGAAQHAVVQARIEDDDRSMVVDALFGVYFPNERGGYYSVWDIHEDESILAERLRELGPTQPFTRDYPLERYTYEAPRTINWNKSWATQQLYRVLSRIMGPRVDDLPRPSIVGDPVLLTLAIAVLAQLTGALGALLFGRFRIRRQGAVQTA
jgi:hypothetical protein